MHTPFTKVKDYFGPYSLRGLKILPGDETIAFDATLQKDGKPIARIHNTGTGGSIIFSWHNGWNDPEAKAYSTFAATRPPIPDPDLGELPADEETFAWALVEWTDFYKSNKKKLAESIFAQVGEQPPRPEIPDLEEPPRNNKPQPFIGSGAFFTYKLPYSPENAAKVRAALAKQYPGQRVRILNEEVD